MGLQTRVALVGAAPPMPSIIVQVSAHGKLVHVQPGKLGQWPGTKNAGLAQRKTLYWLLAVSVRVTWMGKVASTGRRMLRVGRVRLP